MFICILWATSEPSQEGALKAHRVISEPPFLPTTAPPVAWSIFVKLYGAFPAGCSLVFSSDRILVSKTGWALKKKCHRLTGFSNPACPLLSCLRDFGKTQLRSPICNLFASFPSSMMIKMELCWPSSKVGICCLPHQVHFPIRSVPCWLCCSLLYHRAFTYALLLPGLQFFLLLIFSSHLIFLCQDRRKASLM